MRFRSGCIDFESIEASYRTPGVRAKKSPLLDFYATLSGSQPKGAAMTRCALLLISCWLLIAFFGCGTSNPVFRDYDCFWCHGAGTIRCTACFGKGSTMSFEAGMKSGPARQCAVCDGTGQMKCPTCKGKGKLSNNPVAK